MNYESRRDALSSRSTPGINQRIPEVDFSLLERETININVQPLSHYETKRKKQLGLVSIRRMVQPFGKLLTKSDCTLWRTSPAVARKQVQLGARARPIAQVDQAVDVAIPAGPG